MRRGSCIIAFVGYEDDNEERGRLRLVRSGVRHRPQSKCLVTD